MFNHCNMIWFIIWYHTKQCDTTQYETIIWYTTIQYNTIQYDTIRGGTMIQYNTIRCKYHDKVLHWHFFDSPFHPLFKRRLCIFSLPLPSGWRRRVRKKTVEICMQIFLCPDMLHQSTIAEKQLFQVSVKWWSSALDPLLFRSARSLLFFLTVSFSCILFFLFLSKLLLRYDAQITVSLLTDKKCLPDDCRFLFQHRLPFFLLTLLTFLLTCSPSLLLFHLLLFPRRSEAPLFRTEKHFQVYLEGLQVPAPSASSVWKGNEKHFFFSSSSSSSSASSTLSWRQPFGCRTLFPATCKNCLLRICSKHVSVAR